MASWTFVTIPNISKIYSVNAELDKIILLTPESIIEVDESNFPIPLRKVNFPFGATYKSGENFTFIGSDRHLRICPIGQYDKLNKLPYEIPTEHLIVEGDSIACISDGVRGCLIESGQKPLHYAFSQFAGWNNNFYVGAVLQGTNLFWANTHGATEFYNRTKNGTQSQEVVYKLDLLRGSIEDITENLDCLNMLGRPYGPVTSLVVSIDHLTLYISTEQGIFSRPINGRGWEKIFPGWGNHGLFPQPDGTLITLSSSSDQKQHKFFLYKDGTWTKLATLNLQRDGETVITSIAKRGEQIYVSFFNKKFLAILDISQFNPENYLTPVIATYLNLEDPTVACVMDDKSIAVAAGGCIFAVSESGNTSKIFDVKETINALSLCDDGFLIATPTRLVLTDTFDSTDLKINSPCINSKICSSGETNVYLAGKTITVFSGAGIFEKTIDADFVTDVAVDGDYLYVCGWNNRRNRQPVQIAFLREYKITSDRIEQTNNLWDYSPLILGDNMADTRLYKICIAKNKLYVAGIAAGGNSIFRWNGVNLATPTLATTDAYDYPGVGKTRDAHILYYGVINLNTWMVERGQFSIPRIPKDLVSNRNFPESIYADGENIYLGSTASSAIQGRDVWQFLGQETADYYDGDAALLKVSDDLSQRKFWFTLGHGKMLLFTDKFAVIRADNTGRLPANKGLDNPSLNSNTYFICW
jgi:hypothetical protein